MTEIDLVREEGAAWRFFHDLFRTPTLEQWDWLNSEIVQHAWYLLSQTSGESVSESIPLPDSFEQFHEDYLQAFEVGAPLPAIPLIESHWNKSDAVSNILHENILFYKQFGLELSSAANETADHLRHQLEFMAYLCFMEEECLNNENDSSFLEQIRQGKKDFIQRHLLTWIPSALKFVAEKEWVGWPMSWMQLLGIFINEQR